MAQLTVDTSTSPGPTAAPASSAQGAAGGTGGNEGDAYDPYAGAAPLKDRDKDAASAGILERAGQMLAGTFSQGSQNGLPELDVAALAALHREFSRATIPAGGTVDMSVHVSAEGVVIRASVTGGTAPLQVKEKWRRALIGKRLFTKGSPGASPQEFKFPTQRF